MSQASRSLFSRLKNLILGRPRDLRDRNIFHRLSLIPLLAWVGLGADGLSSSAYGPEEAFKNLHEHIYLAIPLAILMSATVFIISAAYRRIIEEFPHGGGGYVVASKLLGKPFGVLSGSALLIDYVLTITISIAAAGDALFSFVPLAYHAAKIPVEIGLILSLAVLNFRGIKESVLILTPIFVVFLITHAIAIFGGIVTAPNVSSTIETASSGFQNGLGTIGMWGMVLLFAHAYSLGGGTYTGIEAVSNGLPIMREPKVATAKRTMLYMATSLAFTASGLLICYLLWQVKGIEGKTLNAVLLERITAGVPFGMAFVVISLVSEGLLLVVAAQAGFIDGPRVLANMAIDSWLPHRFSALSDRLTTANGIFIMTGAALAALIYTKGSVGLLVVMYSINVFLTFTLSIFGMLKSYIKDRASKEKWLSGVIIFSTGFILCFTILTITVLEKFSQGGWITLVLTFGLVFVCFVIKRHYLLVAKKLRQLELSTEDLPNFFGGTTHLDPNARTAVILVGGYGGLGIQTLRSIFQTFPKTFENFIFVSVGVIDSGVFKGENAMDELKVETERMLGKYLDLGKKLGLACSYRMALGTDVVQEGFKLCQKISEEFKMTTFFTGKIIFSEEKWYQRLLHNETGYALQKQLQVAGHTMVILPAKVA